MTTLMEQRRTELGLSKAELARRARTASIHITWAEQGRFIPYPPELRRIAEALGLWCAPEDLLGEMTLGG